MGLNFIRRETAMIYSKIAHIYYSYRKTGIMTQLHSIKPLRARLKFYQDNCPHIEILNDDYVRWCNTCGAFVCQEVKNNEIVTSAYSDGIMEMWGKPDDLKQPTNGNSLVNQYLHTEIS